MSQSHMISFLLSVFPAVVGAGAGNDLRHERIVTIGGAATEIVWTLGAGDAVVAVDRSSTWPAEVRNLPQVGYVRNVSPEGILSFDPDVVVATGALGPPPARAMMERLGVPVVWLPDPDSVEDLEESVRRVASALGRTENGEALWKRIRSDLDEVADRVRPEERHPRVLFFLEPPVGGSAGMVGGADSRADALIALAGGENAAKEFSGFRPVSGEGILRMNPDVILVAESEGHGAGPGDIEALRQNPAYAEVNALQTGAVYGVPLDDLAFGPRLGEAAMRWSELILDVRGN